MVTPLRILFVGYFKYNSGSSHALLGYVRAARCLGYDLRVSRFGLVDEIIQEKVPVAEQDWTPDIVVMVFESKQFLNKPDLANVERLTQHARTVVIDPDGKYSDTIYVGSDTNHPTAGSQAFWINIYRQFSDTILQPCLTSVTSKTKRFLYFGIDTHRPPSTETSEKKLYDLIYVGNNWYRWHDFVWLFEHLEPIRSKLGRIAVFGKHWFGDPKPGLEEYTYSDPEFLRAHDVESYQSVPFGEVESVMSQGRLHPIFVRPLLNALEFATPRMFETFAANTVPILPPYFARALYLYGKQAGPLYLSENPAETVTVMLDRYPDYLDLTREIRVKLIKEHSYEVRLAELLELCA